METYKVFALKEAYLTSWESSFRHLSLSCCDVLSSVTSINLNLREQKTNHLQNTWRLVNYYKWEHGVLQMRAEWWGRFMFVQLAREHSGHASERTLRKRATTTWWYRALRTEEPHSLERKPSREWECWSESQKNSPFNLRYFEYKSLKEIENYINNRKFESNT